MTEEDQAAGTKLWACSNATSKAAFLSGMADMLGQARTYLYGRADGAAIIPCVGASSPAYCVDMTKAHTPYTLWVPAYTTSA